MKKILISALTMHLFVTSPAIAGDPERIALHAPLPDVLIGNECQHTDLGEIAEGFATYCFGKDMLEDASVGATIAAVSEMSFGDLKKQIRASFHNTGLHRVVSEKRVKLDHSPDVTMLEGVYSTNLGLRRTWSAYHDGVLVRVIISIPSSKADGDFREEVLEKVFSPERFSRIEESQVGEPVK